MKSNIIKILIVYLITNILMINNAWAKQIGFLTKDNNNIYYEYEYEELMESSVDNFLGEDSVLYNDYLSKQLIAFHDDKNGYIASNSVIEESVECFMNDEVFDLNYYLTNEGKNHIVKDIETIVKVKEEDGNLIKEKETNIFDVKDIY